MLDALDVVHDLTALQRRPQARIMRLWPRSRISAWRRVAGVLRETRLDGPQASAKPLRGRFGVQAANVAIPLNMVQKSLGHAQVSTTEMYGDAIGAEEKQTAART